MIEREKRVPISWEDKIKIGKKKNEKNRGKKDDLRGEKYAAFGERARHVSYVC